MENWDWVSISAFATGLGTLVLAVATFASVRSANRAARTAERALLVGMRPLLAASRLSDEPLKVGFGDGHLLTVRGGLGAVEQVGEARYLAISLRNVGHGMAVLHGWSVDRRPSLMDSPGAHAPIDRFRRLTRDLYVPPGDVFFWQGALRDPAAPEVAVFDEAVRTGTPLTVELLYSDEEGGQRMITRFALVPHGEEAERVWLSSVSRHWSLDGPSPR